MTYIAGSGQIALPLRLGGYKIFDLERSTVLTLFSPSLAAEIVQRQVANAYAVSNYSFAPTVLKANVAQRWYLETYTNGSFLPPLLKHKPGLYEHVIPLLAAFAAASNAAPVNLANYVKTLYQSISGAEHGLSHPLVRNEPAVHEITTLLKKFSESLLLEHETVYTVLSHGDIHERNILMGVTGEVAIDWENLDFRSVHYDLYTTLFRTFRPETPFWTAKPVKTEARVFNEISHKARQHLHQQLAHRSVQLASDVTGSHVEATQRKVFYLEFLHKGIQKIWEKPDADLITKRLHHTVLWLRNFEEYELVMKKG